MSAVGRGDPIVVAVDDGGTSDDAVDWAAAEAATQQCPLRIVHAPRPPIPADPYWAHPPIDSLSATAHTAAEAVLHEAVARAHTIASDIDVSARLLRGAVGRALLAQAEHARLLTLGRRSLHSRDLGRWRRLLTRSVCVHLAAHATCPVVVVRPPHDTGDHDRTPARVVVGVDSTRSCTAAVGFAFRAARQRGIPLIAVHAWTPDPPADAEMIPGPRPLAALLARQVLERALRRWRREFPDVSVHAALVRGSPESALLTHSRGAALLVVGARGRGLLRGVVRGSVSQTLMRHGHSPLAIIRHDNLAARSSAIS
jgi:nucleotide-binding universal stress UspA family protein